MHLLIYLSETKIWGVVLTLIFTLFKVLNWKTLAPALDSIMTPIESTVNSSVIYSLAFVSWHISTFPLMHWPVKSNQRPLAIVS